MIRPAKRTTSSPSAHAMWHRHYVLFKTVRFEHAAGRCDIRFETVLRRWSANQRRWLYAVASNDRCERIIGTRLGAA